MFHVPATRSLFSDAIAAGFLRFPPAISRCFSERSLLQRKVAAPAKDRCSNERSLFQRKIAVSAKGRCFSERSLFQRKVAAPTKDRCFSERSLLQRKIAVSAKGRCFSERSLLQRKIAASAINRCRWAPGAPCHTCFSFSQLRQKVLVRPHLHCSGYANTDSSSRLCCVRSKLKLASRLCVLSLYFQIEKPCRPYLQE